MVFNAYANSKNLHHPAYLHIHIRAQLFKTNNVVNYRIVKTLIINHGIYESIFAEKMWVAFAFAKATHIFFSKNTCELDIVFNRTVNILTTYNLVKLTMLWTTGPWAVVIVMDSVYLSTKIYWYISCPQKCILRVLIRSASVRHF